MDFSIGIEVRSRVCGLIVRFFHQDWGVWMEGASCRNEIYQAHQYVYLHSGLVLFIGHYDVYRNPISEDFYLIVDEPLLFHDLASFIDFMFIADIHWCHQGVRNIGDVFDGQDELKSVIKLFSYYYFRRIGIPSGAFVITKLDCLKEVGFTFLQRDILRGRFYPVVEDFFKSRPK